MNEAVDQAEPAARTTAEETAPTAWQTPGYAIVDTALEVTAYSLSIR
ncbi:pyrroloquinoline quinone precursor peptide PqqA [Streptomyces sp. NRRL S-1022]|nr:pyrroloquinoline quinone precursor peptide PqqA [Streptomyces sp. NRRL S-1022]